MINVVSGCGGGGLPHFVLRALEIAFEAAPGDSRGPALLQWRYTVCSGVCAFLESVRGSSCRIIEVTRVATSTMR